jgi:hypothetical protein
LVENRWLPNDELWFQVYQLHLLIALVLSLFYVEALLGGP